MSLKNLRRWLPAILMMTAIFVFSSIPSDSMPSFDIWDSIVKKGGHMLGYGLLALAYWFPLRDTGKPRAVLAWMLALLYAATDEIHQSFVPGRNASALDVLFFDNLGAALSLLVVTQFSRNKK